MKPFKELKVPMVDRAQVRSPEGKGLNAMFWAVIGLLVKQVNTTLEGLLANINPNFPLWGRCHVVRVHNRDSGLKEMVAPSWGIRTIAVRHELGRIPRYWVVINKQADTPEDQTVVRAWGIQRTNDPAWTDTHVFFRIDRINYGQNIFWDILLLP